MNIQKYRKHYLASLHGLQYEEPLDRTFPRYRGIETCEQWERDRHEHVHNRREIDDISIGTVWMSSDHHFFHKNIIRFAGRPHASVDEMNQDMVDKHNAVVRPEDISILGGDIGFGPVDATNEILNEMNGYKILIIGNHDWEHKKATVKKYAVNEMYMSYFIKWTQYDILITHAPFIATDMLLNERLRNIYGHIHEKTIDHPRYINMCVEHSEYRPRLLLDMLTGT